MTSLRKITIQARLWLILIATLICVSLIEIQAMRHLFLSMKESRQIITRWWLCALQLAETG